jgi:trehalose-6-phosphate synthase
MQRLARQVDEHNIYRWAAGFLTQLAATRGTAGEASPGNKAAAS